MCLVELHPPRVMPLPVLPKVEHISEHERGWAVVVSSPGGWTPKWVPKVEAPEISNWKKNTG